MHNKIKLPFYFVILIVDDCFKILNVNDCKMEILIAYLIHTIASHTMQLIFSCIDCRDIQMLMQAKRYVIHGWLPSSNCLPSAGCKIRRLST